MKKILLFLAGAYLLYSCNPNCTNPAQPGPLVGSVISNTRIDLSWTDNSNNETGFKILRRTETPTGTILSPYTLIGTTSADIISYSDTGLTPFKHYTYQVYAINAECTSEPSNQITLYASVITAPVITTSAVSSINTSTAICGGTIVSDGGGSITARGVCWSTSPEPTVALPTKTVNGSGIGTFVSNLNGLLTNTTYFVRAYATNAYGTFYGPNINFYTADPSIPYFFDIDGNKYLEVNICNQTWMQSNLTVSKYTDGTEIPQVSPWQLSNQNLTTGAWCYWYQYPGYIPSTNYHGIIYGKLYNWYAVAGIHDAASWSNPGLRKKLAPNGWHTASDAEWSTLTSCLGGEFNAGGKMKETGTTHWSSPNTGATNSSGFTALPGLRVFSNGGYCTIGSTAYWWSSTEYAGNAAWTRYVGSGSQNLSRNSMGKGVLYSVRCVKD